MGTAIVSPITSEKTITSSCTEKTEAETDNNTFRSSATAFHHYPKGGIYVGPFFIAKVSANFLSGSGYVYESSSSRFLDFEFGPYGDGKLILRPLRFWKNPLIYYSNWSGTPSGLRIACVIKHFYGKIEYSGDRTIINGWCILVDAFLDPLIIIEDASLIPTDDSYVDAQYPSQNYGTNDVLEVSDSDGSETARSYLKFDTSDIPSNIVLHYALLSLYYCGWEGTGEPEVGIFQVKDNWDENNITWNNQPDFSSNSEYSFLIPPAEPQKVEYWDITDLAKGWITGNIPNNGIVLKYCNPCDENITRRVFKSKESSTEKEKPTLIISYNSPPEKPNKPSGLTNLKIGKEYNYTTRTIETNGDRVYFWFDWGDGTNSGWVGPYDPFAWDAIASHAWESEGNYQIKVKAKDTWGLESIWSDPLNVTVYP